MKCTSVPGQLIDSLSQIQFSDPLFGFLLPGNLFPGKKVRQSLCDVEGGFSSLSETDGVCRCRHAGHGISGVVRQNLYRCDLNAVRTGPVQAFHGILAGYEGMHLNIHIFAVTFHSHAKGGGKCHDLMRTVAPGVSHIQTGSADGLLKIAHHIQMPDKSNGTVFFKFNSQFHWVLLTPLPWIQSRCRRRIWPRRSPGTSACSFRKFPPVLLFPTLSKDVLWLRRSR